MFSGKTSELMRRVRRYKLYKKCLVISYKGDNRYSSEAAIITHDRAELKAQSAYRLSEAENAAHSYSVIGIDEGQFFPDVVDYVERWANAGKTVIVAALDGTFQRKPFNHILQLIPLAEEVLKLRAICSHCHREAAFTHRLGDEKDVEVVGGAEAYTAACRACFRSLTWEKGQAAPLTERNRGPQAQRNPAVKTRSASGRAKQRQHEADENTPANTIAKTERRLSGLVLR
ncbi:g4365 [Coccomyxa viridis]|uniref:Thymidine kinase n=1 Tax=Coccomyxa viridis TaxID=1274662 RepID=A0ABP1FT93_9CHLO